MTRISLKQRLFATALCICGAVLLASCAAPPQPKPLVYPAKKRTSDPSLMRLAQAYLESVETTTDVELRRQLFFAPEVSDVQVTWASRKPRTVSVPDMTFAPGVGATGGFDVAVAYTADGNRHKAYLVMDTFTPERGQTQITQASCEQREWKRRLRGLTPEEVDAKLGEPSKVTWRGWRLYPVARGQNMMLLEVRFKSGAVDDLQFVFPSR